jgi:hypothetical protein
MCDLKKQNQQAQAQAQAQQMLTNSAGGSGGNRKDAPCIELTSKLLQIMLP